MKSNGFQVFRVTSKGIEPVEKPVATFEEAEARVRIPRDLMGDMTYIVLPVYTNKLPIKD